MMKLAAILGRQYKHTLYALTGSVTSTPPQSQPLHLATVNMNIHTLRPHPQLHDLSFSRDPNTQSKIYYVLNSV